MSRRRLLILAEAVLGIALVASLSWVAIDFATTSEVDSIAITSLIATIAALPLATIPLIAGRQPGSRPTIEELADRLAKVLEDDARAEVVSRQLRDPHTLALDWAWSTRFEEQAPHSGVRIKSKSSSLSRNIDVAIAELASAYRNLPAGRIVLLGEPGAGKSVIALLLTLGLLASRSESSRVPILVPTASWDPVRQSLGEWLVEYVGTTYYNGDRTTPRVLLDHDMVIPVLDGLDEIPETDRRVAMGEINVSTRTSGPVIVTCRSTEYGELIQAGVPALYRAPIIEVLPVPLSETEEYFDNVEWPLETSWTPVFAAMRKDNESPVRLALSTPLMITTAKTVYERFGGRPADLLDASKYDSRHAIEEFLIGRLVDAAYVRSSKRDPRLKWSADKSQQWLRYLALYLHAHRERDIRWWSMADRLLSAWVPLIAGVAIAMAAAVGPVLVVRVLGIAPSTDAVYMTVAIGASAGGIIGLLVMLVWFASRGQQPGQLSLRREGAMERLRHGWRSGVGATAMLLAPVLSCAALVNALGSGWTIGNIELFMRMLSMSIGITISIGFGVGVSSWLNGPPARAGRATLAGSLKHDRRSSFASALFGAFATGVTVASSVIVWLILGIESIGLATDWAGWPGRASISAVFFTSWTGVEATPSTALPVVNVIVLGLISVLIAGLVGLLIFMTRAWPRYQIFVIVSFLLGRLPRNLTAFLADAHDRNLLRQSGPSYQFRHVRLQEYLVRQAAPPQRQDLVGRRIVQRRRHLKVTIAAVTCAAIAVAVAALPRNGSRTTLSGSLDGSIDNWTKTTSGSLFATYGHRDPRIQLWNISEEKPVEVIETNFSGVDDASFSDDGRYLMIRSAALGTYAEGHRMHSTSVWDTLRSTFLVKNVGNAIWVADGAAMLTTTLEADPKVELWDLGAQTVTRTYSGSVTGTHKSSYNFVVTRPNGVASMFNALTGDDIADLVRPGRSAAPVEFSPNGKVIYSYTDSGLALWSASTGTYEGLIPDILGSIRVRFNADDTRMLALLGGQRLEGPSDYTARVWDTTTLSTVVSVSAPAGFGDVAFSPIGDSLVSTILTKPPTSDGSNVNDDESRDDRRIGTVEVWDAAKGGMRFSTDTSGGFGFPDANDGLGFPDANRQLEATPADALVTYEQVADGSSRSVLSDLKTGARLAVLPVAIRSTVSTSDSSIVGPTSKSASAAMIDPSGTVLLWLSNDTFYFTSLVTGRLIASLPGAANFDLSRTNFSPDGAVCALTFPDRILIFRPEGSSVVLDRSQGASIDEFSPDGETVATISGSGESATVWDLRTGSRLNELVGHSGPISDLQYIDPVTVITVGHDGTVRIWDAVERR